MATEFALTLKIATAGKLEAMNALNDLNKRGREIVEGVAASTGRAMGDIAVAYENGSRRVKLQLQNIADGHADNIRAMEQEAQAAARTGAQQERATVAISRGIETMARTGREGGRALDTVITSIASGFGLGGPILGAIGIATVAMVEMFNRTSREAKKAADDAVREFSRIAHLDTRGQGEAASLLYSGDPYAQNANERPSIPGLNAEAARARARIAAGTSSFAGAYGITTKSLTDDAKAATDELATVIAELNRRRTLLDSITGPGGSLTAAGTAQAAADLPGFTTDQQKEAAAAAKRANAAAQKAAREALKERERWQRELLIDAKDAANQMVKDAQFHDDFISGALGIPSTKDFQQQFKASLFELNEMIAESIKNDKFLQAKKAFDEAVKSLARSLQEELQRTLGDGLSAGFEAAFSGKGITGAFKALTATVLAGLGGFMEQLGAQMIVVGVSLTALADSLLSLNGPGAIAAGVALVAAGAGLKAIAGSFGGGAAGGSGSGGSSAGAGLGSIIDRGVIGPNSYSQTDARTIPNKPIVQVSATIFGTNDAGAQRGFDEMMRKAMQRGSLAGV